MIGEAYFTPTTANEFTSEEYSSNEAEDSEDAETNASNKEDSYPQKLLLTTPEKKVNLQTLWKKT